MWRNSDMWRILDFLLYPFGKLGFLLLLKKIFNLTDICVTGAQLQTLTLQELLSFNNYIRRNLLSYSMINLFAFLNKCPYL